MQYFKLVIVILSVLASPGFAQEGPGIGEWQTYLSYGGGQTIAETPDRYYAGTNHGLYAFNTRNNTLETFSPLQGFSGVNITSMRYHAPTDQLFIAYQSGLIDIVENGNTITTLNNIAEKDVVGAKQINDISFIDGKAYFSTSFGIIAYNLAGQSFGSSFFGPLAPQWNTTGITKFNDTFYAATQEGLLKAPTKGVNLKDVSVWQTEREEQLGNVKDFQNRLYFAADSQILIYEQGQWKEMGFKITGRPDFNIDQNKLFIARPGKEAIVVAANGNVKVLDQIGTNRLFLDEDNNRWFGNSVFPLLKQEGDELRFFLTDGPDSRGAWSLTIEDQTLYVAGGSITDNFSAAFNPSGFYVRQPDGEWNNYNRTLSDTLEKLDIRDFVNIAADPRQDRFFAASFEDGLVSYRDGEFYRHYTPANSGLSRSPGDLNVLRVADVKFDKQGNLWMTNNAASEALVCFTSDGNWYSYSLNGISTVLDLVIDNQGRKWIRTYSSGLVVYDNNGTIANKRDDRIRKLDDQNGSGGLPSSTVLSMAEDKEGNMWIGTADGVGVIFNTRGIFNGSVNARDVFVESGENSGLLLTGERVTAISVDGGNNKWFGTPNGVWYTSSSGDQILNRFTTDNSPLLSNDVRDIAIDGESGRVYFATPNGLLSYRGRATEGQPEHDEVYAYPNPVKPGYNGTIAIKGLVTDAAVKITDASGNLVSSMQANGGQATWDGTNRNGNRVNSGVYYVYSTDEQGNKTKVTKILVMQ